MARSNTKVSFENVFFDALRRGSNLNHSCPYSVSRALVLFAHLHSLSVFVFYFQNAIIVKNMLFKEEYFKYFPLPPGEYKFQLMASTDNDWKTIVSLLMRRIVE